MKSSLQSAKKRVLPPLTALLLLLLAAPAVKAQAPPLLTVPDCNYSADDVAMEFCLRNLSLVLRANRDLCIAQLDRARRLQAAGRSYGWADIPSGCYN